jgi:hypothetical protein
VCAEAEETVEHQDIKTKHNQMTAFRLVCSRNEETKDVLEKRALFNIVIDEQVFCEYGFSPYLTTNSVLPLEAKSTQCCVWKYV